MARPSALTSELRETIERQLADGIPVAVVAQNASVSRSTLHSWISSGRVVRRRRRDPLKLVARPVEASAESSTVDLEERLRAAEPGLVAAIANAAGRGSWQSAAWLLARIAPERWAMPSRSTSPADSRPSRDDPFWEVDELARKRRDRLGR
jgi:hypothetical protein